MTPDAVEEKYGVPPRALQRPRRARRRVQRQPARRPRCRAQDCREVAGAVRRPHRPGRARRRDQGQGGGRAARAPRRGAAQPPPQPARPRRGARGRCRGPRPHQLGPRGGAPRLRRTGVPSAARPALRVPSSRWRPSQRAGFDLDTNVLGSEDVTGWLEHHAPKGSRVGVDVVGTWGRGTGDASAVAMATPDGVAGFIPLIDLDEEAEAALASWAGDPERPKVLHDAKGPMHALAARGIPGSRESPRTRHWRPISCAQTNAPTTWPTSCSGTWGVTSSPRRRRNPRGCSTSRPTTMPPPTRRWCAPGQYSTLPMRCPSSSTTPGVRP
jgi:hypothetical protein